MIDEAHAFCCCGYTLAGISYEKDVDIITATFGKAAGSFGAFCAANHSIIEYLINKARSFIFSTSIPPINIEWSNWLLTEKREYIESRKILLEKITIDVHDYLVKKGIKTPSNSHIIPITIGDNNPINVEENLFEEFKPKKVNFSEESKSRALERIKKMKEKQKEEKEKNKVRKSLKVSNIVKALEETMRKQSNDNEKNNGQ